MMKIWIHVFQISHFFDFHAVAVRFTLLAFRVGHVHDFQHYTTDMSEIAIRSGSVVGTSGECA